MNLANSEMTNKRSVGLQARSTMWSENLMASQERALARLSKTVGHLEAHPTSTSAPAQAHQASTHPSWHPSHCNPWKLKAVQAAISSGKLGEHNPLAMMWNVSELERAVRSVHDAFPGWLHTTAAKANPLLKLFEVVKEVGLGAEAASLGELTQAIRAGFEPTKIVFDSPIKTRAELQYAVDQGVNVNVDNLQELAKLAAIVQSGSEAETKAVKSSLYGIRVNPEVGAGSISTHSTSVPWSKFGVGVLEHRAALLSAYRQYPWLRMVHCHAGSQGCPLELIAAGLRRTVDFALEVNKAAGRQQITKIDCGGGLPVNFSDEAVTPTFQQFAQVLRATVPELFSGQFQVLSEHGRAYFAKCGFIVSRVEHTKVAGGRHIAIQHAGADLAVRTIYHPATWPLRITVLDSHGCPRVCREDQLLEYDVAGPCCIAGDIIASRRMLPLIEPGDYIIVHDTGAYYHSSWSYYNSRQAPALYSFREQAQLTIETIRKAASVDETLRFFT